MFANQKHLACEPVDSPVGRFHHDNQVAIYTSCTQGGAGVALKRYLNVEDAERIIVPLEIIADRIYDIREAMHSNRASVVWQELLDQGERPPTWEYSDLAREAGAQGMLYSSRSRPELTHLVLFDASNSLVKRAGDCRPWAPQELEKGV